MPNHLSATLLFLLLSSHSGREPVRSRAVAGVASVSGTVYDSVALRPLAGARVQLVAADDPSRTRATTSAADGTFHFDSVSSGTWLAGFYHAALDEYGVEVPPERLRVVSGDVIATLAIPSARSIIDNECGMSDGQNSGLYIGFLRTALGTPPARQGHVQVQWNAFTLEGKGIKRSTPPLDIETSEQGGFSICGVPSGGVMVARAWAGSDSSGLVELEVPKAGLMRHDLVIATNRSVEVGVRQDSKDDIDEGARTRVARGAGVLRGKITHSGGAPVKDARVVLWGSGVEVTTDAEGSFAMAELPLGSWTLEARALGYVRARRAVDIDESGSAIANLTLDAVTEVLDTVRVLGQRIVLPPDMRDFERRRKAGFGTFIDEKEIERRHPLFVADLFRMVPGVSVVPTRLFSYSVVMPGRTLGGTVVNTPLGKAKGSAGCTPAFYIDGTRINSDDGEIDLMVSTAEIRAIEIYTRASNVPAQFNSTSGCGSIVIHTGPRNAIRAER